MSDSIGAVVNAGGNSRKEEIPDKFNAIACLELTEERVNDQSDILAAGPYGQAKNLAKGSRIAMLQGGGKSWRNKYGSGEFMACGRIREVARYLKKQDIDNHRCLYSLTEKYFPPGKGSLVGIIFYSLQRSKQRLAREQILVGKKLSDGSVKIQLLRPMPGEKFIEIKPSDPGYPILNEWWNDHCANPVIVSTDSV